jgi:PleD family two-component response regulator
VSLSVGAAVAVPGDTAEGLVRRADEALYASKSAGRNRVTLAGGAAPMGLAGR